MANGSGKCLQHGVNNRAQRRSIEHPKTGTKQGQQSSVQQWTSSAKHKEKITGSCGSYTVKDRVLSTKRVVEGDTRRLVENHREHHWSKTEKIGNKSVHTEYHTKQVVNKSVHTEYHTKQVVRSVNYHKSYKSGTTCCSTKNKH